MGFRLPLDSLPWATPEDIDPLVELDPVRPAGAACRRARPMRASAADRSCRRPPPARAGAIDADAIARPLPGRAESCPGVVRTALCVEPRDGRLHVFLPPQRLLEDYLDLVAAVEATAGELEMPVMSRATRRPTITG